MAQQHKLSAAGCAVLKAAAARDDHLALLPDRLPDAARRLMVQALLNAELVEEVEADDEQPACRTAENGTRYVLQATAAGLKAIGVAPAQHAGDGKKAQLASDTARVGQHASVLPVSAQQTRTVSGEPDKRQALRTAAAAVLSAWDDPTAGRPVLGIAIDVLRAALVRKPKVHATQASPRQPRPDTKRAIILALLRRPEGTTVAQVVDATGWARHTVHGFFAGLKKAGTPIEVLERVRQVGPGKQGRAGSYTVYRAAEAN